MDAMARYGREVLEFILGAPQAGDDDAKSDAQSSIHLTWRCGCSAHGQRDLYQIFPCAEHRSEFEGTHNGSSADGHADGTENDDGRLT